MNTQTNQVPRENLDFHVLESLKDMVWQYGKILTFFDVTERIAVFGVPIEKAYANRNDKGFVVSRNDVIIDFDAVHNRVIVTVYGAARFEYIFWIARATWTTLNGYHVIVVVFDSVTKDIDIP